jgi:hypothetical protein
MPSFTVGPVMSTDDALDFSPKKFYYQTTIR